MLSTLKYPVNILLIIILPHTTHTSCPYKNLYDFMMYDDEVLDEYA